MRTALVAVFLALTFVLSSQGAEPRLWATLTGHRGAVNAIACSPCLDLIASASEDGTVKLWNLTTGKYVATYVHPGPVLSVAFDDSGLRLIAGCRDGTVKTWNLITGNNTATIHAELPARRVWFGSSIPEAWFGRNHAGVAYPAESKPFNGLAFWDLDTGKQIPITWDHPLLNLDVSTGNAVANMEPNYLDCRIGPGDISFHPGTIDGPRQAPIALRGHKDMVTSLTFSPRYGKWLVSGSLDKTIKLWDTATGKCIVTLTDHSGAVNCVEFTRDGKTLVSGSADGTIKFWNMPEDEDR